MEEKRKILAVLNKILIDELNAINYNAFHSQLGYNISNGQFFEEIERETVEEFKQAEWLLKRIIFLEVFKNRQMSMETNQYDLEDREKKRVNVG